MYTRPIFTDKQNNVPRSDARGFTLIELLVVITIIAILSTIVLAFIGNQNKKAEDKKTQQQVASMRSQAQLYAGTTGVPVPPTTAPMTAVLGPVSGSTLFNDSNFSDNSLFKLIDGLPSGTIYYYGWDGNSPSQSGQWFFAATISVGTVCADWTGASKTNAVMPTTDPSTWSTVVNSSAGNYSCL